jgi:amino acid adenylation domain-containing protein
MPCLCGVPIADRGHKKTRDAIGFFINTIALRTDLSGDPTFIELLARVRDRTLGAYAHHETPINLLVQRLRLARAPDRDPVFQVVFSMEPPVPKVEWPGLRTEPVSMHCQAISFDLTVQIVENSEGFKCQFDYRTALFDAATMERLAVRFRTLLEAIIAEPERRVSELPLLTEAERQQLIVDWNSTSTPYPADTCIHEEFQEQARLQPDAPAIVEAERTLTYRELDHRSEQLANHLYDEGVRTGKPVALCMDRSVEMIIGMLAILKAGGTYVPLDPVYPAERLALMLNDVAAEVILTVTEVAKSLATTTAKVICLDGDLPLIQSPGARSAATSAVTSSHLAYVIFTSGSTGKPKGVAVPHRAVVRLVKNTNYVELGPTERIAHLSNVCFDAATFEIWGALLNGGSVVVISKELALDPRQFGEELSRHGVSILFLTTALFNELARADATLFQGLNQVLFGGEAVNPQWVRQVMESARPKRLLHVYGPTECTTFATFYPVTHVEKNVTTIPIGKPISNTTAYVLDKQGHPVPIGIPGELYLGGPGVAEGYPNEPELTRERFVPDPFVLDQTQRLYRTGDVVKFLPDGNIEFIGRCDGQVKIRGFRIEPGEVEVVLRRYIAVEDAVVVAREDEPGERELVAYIVPRRDSAPGDWRGFLQGKLPAYMIPSAFVELDALPMTPSGKVDRLALPKPERRLGENSAGVELTPTEQIVSNVWANVLGTDGSGVEKSFFELGGHSLLAIQVVTALRQILQIEIPVNALFSNPTVSSFSRHLDQIVAQNLQTVRPPIERVSREEPLPLSFAQERLWRNERDAADSSNVMVFTIEGELDVSGLERCLQELVRRHEIFRSTFHTVDGQPVQRVAPEADFRLGFLDLSETPDPEAETLRLLLAEKTSGINLEREPLMRASVFRWTRNHHKLVLTLHHMAYDIWSLPIFFNELHALYGALSAGRASPLTVLGVQQADFAVWQRKYLHPDSTTYQAHLAFWLKQLSGNPILRLPCERPTPLKTASINDVIARFKMSDELSAAIRELSRQEGATLFMTFLAALKALINLHTGQNEIMLGTYMANRSASGSENMMGYFCDIGLLRTTLSSDLSFLETLRRVRETVLNAHAHEDLPFEVLGEEMQKRGYGLPVVRAIFMVGTSSTKPHRLGEIEMKPFPGGNTKTTMPWNFQMGVHDHGRVFDGRAKFDACQHDPNLVRKMVRSYVRLLEAVAKDPAARLSDLEEALVGR